ncbi:hypothetical protein ACVJ6Q_007058, partial [Bradyrhizobium elkanii]
MTRGPRSILSVVPGLTRQLLCWFGLQVRLSVSHHGIEDREQLPGDGDEGEFGWFSGLSQSCIEGLERISSANCVEGRH